MCVFFEHFLQFFIDLLFGCLHKQSISIENVLSSRVVTLHSVVGNGHISPFSRQSLRWGRSLLLSSLNVFFIQISDATRKPNSSTKMEGIIITNLKG